MKSLKIFKKSHKKKKKSGNVLAKEAGVPHLEMCEEEGHILNQVKRIVTKDMVETMNELKIDTIDLIEGVALTLQVLKVKVKGDKNEELMIAIKREDLLLLNRGQTKNIDKINK